MAKTFIFRSKMIDFSELLSAHDKNLRSSLGARFYDKNIIILLSYYLLSYYLTCASVLFFFRDFEL